jgi:hypothetical protein
MDTTMHPAQTNGTAPTKLDALKQALADAKTKRAKSEKARDKADEKVETAAEQFRQARLDADAAQAQLDADTKAVDKATAALRAEQRNVG